MAQLAADGSAAQAPTYEQWLEEQCDLGLLVVDIDDFLDEIMAELTGTSVTGWISGLRPRDVQRRRPGACLLRRGRQALLGVGEGVSAAAREPQGCGGKANLTAAQRWWRTMPEDVTVEQAQAGLDRFTSLRADARVRVSAEGRSTVAAIADTEPLAPGSCCTVSGRNRRWTGRSRG